ncbi:hypothetical protein Pcinc_015696 [Petrolisthes cinctipes]|uniref:Uncharacterized protein n=1 Tax=Petrolisthes cinctipes TaxID=88211 RepID=A0AAE1FST6_PETCI|nr:hypothetical protein Pcinc_015696 [Petrolisthes cinctipes]
MVVEVPPPTIITLQHNPCEIIPWILEVAGNDLTEEDKEELEEYVEEMCDNSTESESSEERFFFNRPNPLQALNTLCTRLNSFIAGVSGLVVTGNDLATANATQLIATVITNMCGARRSLLREDEPAPQDSTPFPPPPFGSHPPPHPKEDDMDEDSEEGTRPPPPPPSGGPPPPSGGPPPRPWTIEPRN